MTISPLAEQADKSPGSHLLPHKPSDCDCMDLTKDELAYFSDIGALEHDDFGRLVFVGLSYEESWELKYFHDTYLQQEQWSNPDRYLDLMIRHERARLKNSFPQH